MVGSLPDCCARAASGHAVAVPAITLMKSRRRIAVPRAKDRANVGLLQSRSNQETATGGIGALVSLRSSNPEPPKTGMGHQLPLGANAERVRYDPISGPYLKR